MDSAFADKYIFPEIPPPRRIRIWVRSPRPLPITVALGATENVITFVGVPAIWAVVVFCHKRVQVA
jgi:hypothetical protein